MSILAPDLEQATVTMTTNFTATLNISRAMFPLLRTGGRIVNVASSTGLLRNYSPTIQVMISQVGPDPPPNEGQIPPPD